MMYLVKTLTMQKLSIWIPKLYRQLTKSLETIFKYSKVWKETHFIFTRNFNKSQTSQNSPH